MTKKYTPMTEEEHLNNQKEQPDTRGGGFGKYKDLT
jgi:hypothetical protein